MQVNFDVLNLEIVTRNYLNLEVVELGTKTGLILKLKKLKLESPLNQVPYLKKKLESIP
jgi:hypothetical protein